VCSVLGIEIVVFAAFATVVLVRCRDLENFDAGLLHVAQKPRAIGAGRLDADALERSEGSHPGKHLPVPLSRCGEALAPENAVLIIDNGGDMQILMRVDTAADAMTGNFLTDFHIGSSWFDDALTVSPRPNAWTGQ
jgi:hypothetical protein